MCCLGSQPRTKVIKRLLFLLQTLSSWYLGNGHWIEQQRGWETEVQELGEGHKQPLWWERGPTGSSIQKKNNWWFQAAELRAGREMRQPMREEDTDPCHYPKKETKNRCKRSGFSYETLLGLAAFGTLRRLSWHLFSISASPCPWKERELTWDYKAPSTHLVLLTVPFCGHLESSPYLFQKNIHFADMKLRLRAAK